MDFGMPTLLEIESLHRTVELCGELGLQFIELNMNLPQYQPGQLTSGVLRRHLDGPVYFTLHLDENLNIWDFNPFVCNAYMDTVLSCISLAGDMDIPIINMHMHKGVYFTYPDQKIFLYERFFDSYMEKTMRFGRCCEEEIGGRNIKICIENCGGFPDFQQKAIEYLLQSRVFGLTLDIGHSHSAGGVDEPFVMRHEGRIEHMHFHDAIAGQNHLALGTGDIDIEEKLALARRRSCRCVLETKTVEGLRLSVANLHRYL